MAGSRALKEVTLCKNHGSKGGKKESAATPASKQYSSPKQKSTGPNYPQWHLGGKSIGKL